MSAYIYNIDKMRMTESEGIAMENSVTLEQALNRIEELEKENARLKRLVADLSLDNAIWKDINEGKL